LDLLILLLENRDRLVTRDEIIDRVWRGRVVSAAALNSRIKSARQAIGDSGASQKLLRTIRGRGFRLVGEASPSPCQSSGDGRTGAPTTLGRTADPGMPAGLAIAVLRFLAKLTGGGPLSALPSMLLSPQLRRMAPPTR
jgi:hypothetical protein